jgi:hypothetical protein
MLALLHPVAYLDVDAGKVASDEHRATSSRNVDYETQASHRALKPEAVSVPVARLMCDFHNTISGGIYGSAGLYAEVFTSVATGRVVPTGIGPKALRYRGVGCAALHVTHGSSPSWNWREPMRVPASGSFHD